MKYTKNLSKTLQNVFIGAVLAIGCITYTTFLLSSQPMPGMGMPGGMPGGPLPPLTEADIAELENLYQSLTANMSPEEKDMLQKMGEDLMNQYQQPAGQPPQKLPEGPGAFKPPMPQPTLPPLRPEGEIKEKPQPRFELSKEKKEQIEEALETLTKYLGTLMTMMETSEDFAKALKPWSYDIPDLFYSIKIINKPQHIERLASPEFGSLLRAIELLNKAFKQRTFLEACSSAEGCDLETLEDPYTTLNLFPGATQKEVDAAFKKIEKKFEHAKQKESQSDLTPAEQEKRLRSAQFTFDLAKNAYDMIKDPKMRAILEKERAAKQTAEKTMHESIKQSLDVISQELGSAIYNNQLLSDIAMFLKKYEPTQLEERKKLEQSEAARMKEYKEQLQRKTQGKLIQVGQERPSWGSQWYPPYGGGYPGGYQPGYQPPVGPGVKPPPPGKADEKKQEPGYHGWPQTQPGEDKKKEQGEPDKEAAKKDEKKGQKQEGPWQPIFDKTARDIQTLDKTFEKFNNLFDHEYFANVTLPLKPGTIEKPGTFEEANDRATRLYTENDPNPDEILEKIETMQEIIDAADQNHKYSYAYWWNSQKNRKEFEENLGVLQPVLDAIKDAEEQQKPVKTPVTKGAPEEPEATVETAAQVLQQTASKLKISLQDISEKMARAQNIRRGKAEKQKFQETKKTEQEDTNIKTDMPSNARPAQKTQRPAHDN